MLPEFYEFIHAMEEVQKMRLTSVWLECDSALVCIVFTVRTNVHGSFVIDEIFVLITVEKSSLGLFIFFVKGMYVLISWLI